MTQASSPINLKTQLATTGPSFTIDAGDNKIAVRQANMLYIFNAINFDKIAESRTYQLSQSPVASYGGKILEVLGARVISIDLQSYTVKEQQIPKVLPDGLDQAGFLQLGDTLYIYAAGALFAFDLQTFKTTKLTNKKLPQLSKPLLISPTRDKFIIAGDAQAVILELPSEHAEMIKLQSALSEQFGAILSGDTALVTSRDGICIYNFRAATNDSAFRLSSCQRCGFCLINEQLYICDQSGALVSFKNQLTQRAHQYATVRALVPPKVDFDLRPQESDK